MKLPIKIPTKVQIIEQANVLKELPKKLQIKKKWKTYVTVVLAAVVFIVGVISYNGLNGMGLHRLTTRREKGTVNFWYTNEKMTNYYNNIASVYNQSNRGATVVPKLISASEYIEQIYDASIKGVDYPDVYVITSDAMEKAYLSGLTLPVENEKEVRAAFPTVASDAASYEDILIGYPLYFDTSTLAYNKTMLEAVALQQFQLAAKAEGVENPESITVSQEEIDNLVALMVPETIDELLELANNLEAPEGLETVFKWNINDIFFNYFYLGAYANLSVEELDIYNESTAACMDVFKRVTEFFYMDAATASTEGILQEFMEGKVLFTILDAESALTLETANANGEIAFEYDYALTPNPSETLEGRPLSSANIIVVNGYADQPTTANDFATFLTMENYATDQLYAKTGYLPAYQNATVDSNMEKVFKLSYEQSVGMPSSMITSDFWMLLENAFNEIWDGADANTTLETLEEQLKTRISQS